MGKPIIYQMLPRLWGEGKFSSVDDSSLDYFRELGATHIWYTGIPRHSTGKPFVKGRPGSPYAVCDWFDTNPYLADNEDERMAELEGLFRRTREHGLKIVIDFIPNHTGRDYGRVRARKDIPYLGDSDDVTHHWIESNDYYYYPDEALKLPVRQGRYKEFPARASGNSFAPAPGAGDWYDTIRLNYCSWHTATWDKMLAVLDFWAEKGVDAFRCDMVEMVPVEFFEWAIAETKARHPGTVFIAEIYQKANYRRYLDAGFDSLYDKSGLYDILRGITMDSVGIEPQAPFSGHSAAQASRHLYELGSDAPRMLNFLENHDEQRLASPYFALSPQNGFAALGASLLSKTSPFMLYFGQETGEGAPESADGRTSIFDAKPVKGLQELSSFARGKQQLSAGKAAVLERYRYLLSLASEDVISKGVDWDLGYCNAASEGFDRSRHMVFMRSYAGRSLLILCNFAATDANVRLLIPEEAAAALCVSPGTVEISAPALDCKIVEYR